ncbi:MAG: N-6 DNA methylase [Bacteroidetes bacterium]|nr:N-6 DNA methylase [Bacteroidota bacterium]
MTSKQEAYNEISELVERFTEQYDSYKKADYNETLTRRDFIDPFFKALGWDIDNKNGYAEAYREVIHEDRVKIGKATKAPDYSFRLVGGKRLFFVEAKKPSVAVKDEIQPAYQVRRYGWSAKLPVSIITDFEEFSVYDCTKKPNPTDKASVARIKYLTFKDYLKEFDFLWDTFSKERVLKGSFDKFIEGNLHKKGTATVDKEFLQSLDSWRTYLATSIAINNKHLDEDEINFAVQQTIDRIIFLRIAEDRSVEPYGALKDTVKSGNFYQNLFHLFQQADDKYNSGLFDFRKDKISKALTIDNKVVKTIVNELYYPESPYEFSVLSVEILGSAYEQFLGKTITIDKAHRARIEEKPEVRKAGGVYYTPQYVVDYIVKNTVGKLIENKTPKDISKIKIVDPACGSGSFLIGAYQYLLDWHKNYYTDNGKISKGNKGNPLTPEGNLTTAEKKRILLNNIFGVDIDVNAVEVTKLSLLLKCMEGETSASISHQLQMFNERVLPTLDENIKSGNSLVDIDFYATQLDFGDEKKIKPFNWQKGFPEVFKQGGFDVVLGNPPWVDIKGHPQELVKYYFSKFKTTENRINLYSIFVEQGLNILSDSGIFGFIIPNSILFQSSYEKIRRFILTNYGIDVIVRLPDNVFQNVKAETIILNIKKSAKKVQTLLYDRIETISEISTNNCKEHKAIETKQWLKNEFAVFDIFSNKTEQELLKKIEQGKIELISLCDFTLGLTPYDKYKGHTPKQIQERAFHSTTKRDKTFKPLLEGADVKRYFVQWGGKEYISYGSWLGAPREQRFFNTPRILVRQIVSGNPLRIYAGYTEEELYNTQSVFNLISKDEKKLNTKYLLALMNSNLLNFYHSHKYLDLSKNLFQKILIQNCKKFPIRVINAKSKSDLESQSEIIKLVDQLLALNKEVLSVSLESKQNQLQNKIDYCENRINQLVYQLYELTEDDVKIIEGK